ncbi:MAG: LON peptidase substrate-binding domain-containing protein [Woeseiaceae bacterium]|nr:LON peptidase substrate-binding domain-containing protein [Woeseiaceae bacterium]
MHVPLFPLNTVLFPGGPLPLRIFESRYLDMISNCLKSDVPFGVLLIRDGGEVGPATTHEIGTLAQIIDWYQGSDGLLGITAIGTQRFRLLSAERQEDGLNVGKIELLPDVETMPLPSEFRALPDILASIIDDLGRLYENLGRRYDDAAWMAYRFAEILPVEMARKQACLESDDVLHCLRFVNEVLHA